MSQVILSQLIGEDDQMLVFSFYDEENSATPSQLCIINHSTTNLYYLFPILSFPLQILVKHFFAHIYLY